MSCRHDGRALQPQARASAALVVACLDCGSVATVSDYVLYAARPEDVVGVVQNAFPVTRTVEEE